MVDEHEHYGANRCYDEAINIQTRTTGLPQQISQETANECPDNSYQTIASDDANMQEVATRRLSDEPDMTTVSIDINAARAVLTGTVNSDAAKAKAEQIVKAVRGVKSVDNQIVVSG